MYRSNYILPAEWYPQSAIQLTWPHEGTDWKPYLEEIKKTYVELSREIATRERLVIVTQDPDDVRELLSDALPPEAMHRVSFCKCKIDDTWARDHGPLTLLPITENYQKHKEGGTNALILKFEFDGWGKKYPHENDNIIARRLFTGGHLAGLFEEHSDFVLEGGAIESDGQGTIMTSSKCQLKRNRPLTIKAIEEQLKTSFRAKRVIWIKHGLLAGDDTDGHIDTIVRMAPKDTLIYTYCDDVNDEHYEEFKALERQMTKLRTINKKPYRLLRVPLPDAIYDADGQRLPATYANFLVINRAVIMPTYNQPQKDDEAAEVLAAAFPRRQIVRIDARTIIRQHGSIHCLTMQFPKGVAR